MTYHSHYLTLSTPQAKSLTKGSSVRIPHKNLTNGKHLVYLTQTQVKKLAKAYQSGKGSELKMSQAQLKWHHKKGGSILSDVWGAAKKLYEHPSSQAFVKKVKAEGKKALGKLLREGSEYVGNKIHPKVGTNFVRPLAHKLLKTVGLGVKKVPKPMKGSGFFDDVGNFFTHDIPQTFTHTIPNYLSTPSNALSAASTAASFIPVIGEAAGPALALASLGARLAGKGVGRKRKVTKKKGGSFRF